MFGVYIHLPFCHHKCPFCDFSVTLRKGIEPQKAYAQQLIKEIQHCAPAWQHHPQIETLFIGGGTPSYFDPKLLHTIIQTLEHQIPFAQGAEVTIECNPEDVTTELLEQYQDMGINRISLGAQSFDNQSLKALGRNHQTSHLDQSLAALDQAKMNNWSMDLIFGHKGQHLEQWCETLQHACRLSPTHISTYELTVEPRTKLAKQVRDQKVVLPHEDVLAQMYEAGQKILIENGYQPYEVSNASQQGFASKHNLACWHGSAYWGLGVSAHSRAIKSGQYHRQSNPHLFSSYMGIDMSAYEPSIETMSEATYFEERIFTGLRLFEGIEVDTWQNIAQTLSESFEVQTQAMLDRGILEKQHGRIRIHRRHMLFADQIARELLT